MFSIPIYRNIDARRSRVCARRIFYLLFFRRSRARDERTRGGRSLYQRRIIKILIFYYNNIHSVVVTTAGMTSAARRRRPVLLRLTGDVEIAKRPAGSASPPATAVRTVDGRHTEESCGGRARRGCPFAFLPRRRGGNAADADRTRPSARPCCTDVRNGGLLPRPRTNSSCVTDVPIYIYTF